MSKVIGGRRFWRIPVMDGEFVCEQTTGLTKKAVGGGNLLVLGRSHRAVLAACERAVKAIGEVPDVITPFPGGIVRSGSKVGSKYKGQIASTNDAYCPTLKGAVNTALPAQCRGGDGDRHRRLERACRSPRRCAPVSTPSPRAAQAKASPISPPAITAAISGRIISTSRRSSRECVDARASNQARSAARPVAADACRARRPQAEGHPGARASARRARP